MHVLPLRPTLNGEKKNCLKPRLFSGLHPIEGISYKNYPAKRKVGRATFECNSINTLRINAYIYSVHLIHKSGNGSISNYVCVCVFLPFFFETYLISSLYDLYYCSRVPALTGGNGIIIACDFRFRYHDIRRRAFFARVLQMHL